MAGSRCPVPCHPAPLGLAAVVASWPAAGSRYRRHPTMAGPATASRAARNSRTGVARSAGRWPGADLHRAAATAAPVLRDACWWMLSRLATSPSADCWAFRLPSTAAAVEGFLRVTAAPNRRLNVCSVKVMFVHEQTARRARVILFQENVGRSVQQLMVVAFSPSSARCHVIAHHDPASHRQRHIALGFRVWGSGSSRHGQATATRTSAPS